MVVNCGCWSLEWERGRGLDNGIFYGGRWFYDDGLMVVSILEKRRVAAGEMGQRSCRVSFSFLGFFSFFFFLLYIWFSGPL